jgi:outer membrane protein assembly factor BamA
MRVQGTAAVILLLVTGPAHAESAPVIGDVTLEKSDVFDLSDPEQNNWLYRSANRLHINTRDKTILGQLLFQPGDPLDKRALEESERILRRNKYLYDASIEVVEAADGVADVVVKTRDVWSLIPELSISRNGGKTRTRIGLEETNLLGRGQLLRVLRDNEIDRKENLVEFADAHLGQSWVSLRAQYSDNSDGHRKLLAVTRPFYALDARWAAGGTGLTDDRRTTMYQFGEEAAEYRHERDYAHVFAGLSKGLHNGYARRWTTGIVLDDNRFSDVPTSSLPAVVPDDRKLVYPYVGLEIVQDGYVTTRNRDQIDRTEDFQMGLQFRAAIGWADRSFGSDRDAAIFSASASRGFGSLQDKALIVSAQTQGRVESGSLANGTLLLDARYYSKQSDKRTFFAALSGTAGHALDLDNPVELGGVTGMRGYPLRYQVGESKFLATIEQRYFTDWYPFRFARVGGAIFADVGRVWGPNPLGEDNRGLLADVGIGLRLALTRVSSGRVIHIDLAFPLNDDPEIDSVQLLIESKKSF